MKFRRYRTLAWCLVLSLVLHFVLVPLIAGLFALHATSAKPVQEVVYRTSSLSLQQRVPARPQQRPLRRARSQPPPRRTAPAARARIATAAAPRQLRELTRINPRAAISVPRVTAFDPQAQQAQFEKTIARLRSEANPLSGVAQAPAAAPAPAAAKHYAFDFSASMGAAPHAEGVLTPLQSWRDGPFTYYYVRYWVSYADGSTETGIVPWPLRYLPKDDPFLQHWEHFPLPSPLADFRLPPGTNMHPLVAFCFAHRDEFNSCPIEHG